MNGATPVRIARDDNGSWQLFNNDGTIIRNQAVGDLTHVNMEYRTANNSIATVTDGTLAASWAVGATGGYVPPLGEGSYTLAPRAGTSVTVRPRGL